MFYPYLSGLQRDEIKLDGVSTRINPQQMKMIPANFISENWVCSGLNIISQKAEAGTAAINPNVMKCS